MNITRTSAKDFAISRFAVDVDTWLSIVFPTLCESDEAKLQALYDIRSEDQLEADKATPEWASASGEDDWSRLLTTGLPTAAEMAPAPLEPPPLPPLSIHKAWFRAALAEAGHLSAVDTAVEAAGPVKQQLWQFATTISRNDADVVAIAAALSIDLDVVFARAAEIRDTRAA